ncbi:NYN domain-containing protein [Geomonas subterranea]|uniref:NYN domain-containing protein n=1 Tax=Geomonas subterranea TaxID=2847989 RepID=A0ABX8LEN1_9BACT|nr:NYN domain-containing protein [Geomonas subterranea]QXE89174.1 NYN domain-containing protein [Geomonas subterranea]QXM08710.1 NYN domain-containing protein [Geomonas subterranea]
MISFTYVDNSNVFIEGQRVAAVANGRSPDIYHAMNNKIFDHTWNIDYGKLHDLVCGDSTGIGCAKLWGSPPPSDTFWKKVENEGFEVTTFDKNAAGKEKKVDVAIAHQVTKDAYTKIDKGTSEIILVAGDRDFVPVIEDLVSEGFRVTVVFWNHAAQELKDAATHFVSLDGHVADLKI